MIDIAELNGLSTDLISQEISTALTEFRALAHTAARETDPEVFCRVWRWAGKIQQLVVDRQMPRADRLNINELMRRAERSIGMAIRNGQRAGVIRRPSERSSENKGRHKQRALNPPKARPDDFMPRWLLNNTIGVYAMAEGTQAQFDQAIQVTRDAGELKRSAVIRSLRSSEPTNPHSQFTDKTHQLALLARGRYSAQQIAEIMGMRVDSVRAMATKADIQLTADAAIGPKPRHIDPEVVVRETVYALEGIAMGVDLLYPENYEQLPLRNLDQWIASLIQSMNSIHTLRKELDRVRRF